MPTPPSAPRHWLPALALALAAGTAGGALFNALGMPLAWMLGSMSACSVAALARLPVATPSRIRPPMSAVIGIILGSSVTPDLFGHARDWLVPLAALPLFLVASAAASILYFQRVGGFDQKTAYFAGMPGGLVEMVLLADASDADARVVSLVHALRILLVVLLLPLAIRLLTGAPVTGVPPASSATLGADDLLWIACAGVGGVAFGVLARLPLGFLLGPLLASAALHATGLSDFELPGWVAATAQVVLGATVGCRFRGVSGPEILRIGGLGLGAVLLLLTITGLFAAAVASVSDYGFTAMLLAYSPGGLAEMSLVAYALDVEVMFVFAMHICRVLLVASGAPLALPLCIPAARAGPGRRGG
jgi:uncharacterized protein